MVFLLSSYRLLLAAEHAAHGLHGRWPVVGSPVDQNLVYFTTIYLSKLLKRASELTALIQSDEFQNTSG